MKIKLAVYPLLFMLVMACTHAPSPFVIVGSDITTSIYTTSEDHKGVIHALNDLQSDIEKVTGIWPAMLTRDQLSGKNPDGNVIIAGTIGLNSLIDQLIDEKKLDVSSVLGKWESSLTTVIKNPIPGISSALVIAGSDKRGTIFGIYELSGQIGVSPWHYWSDVHPRHQDELSVLPATRVLGEPAVKYRGIFINDEAPALSGWALGLQEE